MSRQLILFCLFLTLGCGTNIGHVPKANIIMVNAEGHPVDPTGNVACQNDGKSPCNGKHSLLRDYPQLTSDEYAEHLNELDRNLNRYLQMRQEQGKPHKILIFIHGGLNFQKGTVERAAELHEAILKDSDAYPIFINWQSSLFPSYKDHLFHIRQGEDWREGPGSYLGGLATSPVYLAGDLTRALVRTPIVSFF